MNKKIILSILSLVLLSGCTVISNPEFTSTVTDGNNTAITVNGVDISKNEVYHYMLNSLGVNSILDLALLEISSLEITDQELIDEKVIESISGYSGYAENGNIEEYAISQGYDSQEVYIEEKIVPQVQKNLLKEKYVEIHFDEIMTKYNPHFLKLINFDDEDLALDTLASIETEKEFDDLMNEQNGSDYGLVTTDGGVDESVINSFDKFTTDGIYPELVPSDNGGFYIVYVYNTDLESSDKATLIEELSTSISDMTSLNESYYYNKYKLSVYESYLKKLVEAKY